MPLSSARVAAALFVALTLTAAPASAQPTAQQRTAAEKRNAEGIDAYRRGDFEAARLAFAQALAVLDSLDVLYNLAAAEAKSQHVIDAATHLHRYLHDGRLGETERAKGAKLAAEIDRQIGRVAIEAPSGARIVVDGAPAGEVPLADPVDVLPGRHIFEARLGVQVRTLEVTAAAGQLATARFAMNDEPPTVATVAGVGAAAGEAAPGRPPAPGGAGAGAASADAPPASTPFWTGRTLTAAVLAGSALVAAGVGVGFTVGASSAADDRDRLRAQVPPEGCGPTAPRPTSAACPALADAAQAHTRDVNLATGLFVGATVLAAGAVATWLFWPTPHDSRASTGVGFAPSYVPGGVAGHFFGRF